MENVLSANHSWLTYTLTKALSRCNQHFSIAPELAFESTTGRVQPGIAVCNELRINWLYDLIDRTAPGRHRNPFALAGSV